MPKILLADDSTHAQRMGTKILAAEGIEVVAVSNGDAAVKKLQNLDIDLVLADVYMPGLDGYEVCQWVKNSADHPGLPVVLVVGALEPLMPDRVAQARADGLLKKPFEASAMMEMLRPLIDASMQVKSSRKKNEIDPEKTLPIYERTIAIPPPPGPASKDERDATVPTPPFDIDSTIRIPPPRGSKDLRAQESVILAGAAAASTATAAAHAEEPAVAEPVRVPEPPAPEPPAPMAEMAPPEPERSEVADMIPEMGIPAEEAAEEFTIPDMSGILESTMAEPAPEALAPEPEPEPEPVPTAKWVAEPVEVTPVDQAKLGGLPEVPARRDTPPDWGELLKSVEDGATAIPAAAPMKMKEIPEAEEAVASTALELEMPVEPEAASAPVAAAPAAPAIDEDELRMTIQLCLENALPGLVEEVTSAVLRRLGNP